MLIQTSIYSSILKVTSSNFQGIFLSNSTLQRQHNLDFDLYNLKVPFVISWPIWISVSQVTLFAYSSICETLYAKIIYI